MNQGRSPAGRILAEYVAPLLPTLALASMAAVETARIARVNQGAQQELFATTTSSLEAAAVVQVARRLDALAEVSEAASMMPQVRQPADSALDNLRLGQAPPDDLPTIRASLEPAEALVGELGPSVPLAERPNLASYWSLTRGLPLNAPAGGPALAQARRAWANQFLADHKEFDTVAEFDSGGRVVFLEPYAKQLTLRQFLVRELSSVDSLSVPHRATLLIHAPWYSSAAKASFVIPVYRRDGRRILAFTLKDSISPPDSNGPLRATVFDAAGNIAIDMATGSGGAPTHYENVVARSLAVAIGVHLPRSSPPPPDYFPMGALWLATIASGAIAASVPRMALASTKSRLAHARSTLRHIVSTARKESLDSTQTLAHDFSNSLLEVKSVAMAADGISIEDARRLNSAIGDLEGYLEQAQQSSRQLHNPRRHAAPMMPQMLSAAEYARVSQHAPLPSLAQY